MKLNNFINASNDFGYLEFHFQFHKNNEDI